MSKTLLTSQGMPTVLVVEDDPDMRRLEQSFLECSGFEVLTATNGREGLRELRRAGAAVVILDLMMPVMDGLSFLAERERDPEMRRIPVVCVSAGGQDLMMRAMQLGASECVGKPTDLDHLCALVAHYASASA